MPPAHILVADDEPLVRAYITRTLETCGYQVTAVDDGSSALAALLAEGSDYAALVTDCRMTRMNGPELFSRLRAAGSGVAIILTSGSDPPDEIAGLESDPRAAFLAKPFRPAELLRLVSGLIGQQGA
jgi:DNA-binding response OmpR family regulator